MIREITRKDFEISEPISENDDYSVHMMWYEDRDSLTCIGRFATEKKAKEEIERVLNGGKPKQYAMKKETPKGDMGKFKLFNKKDGSIVEDACIYSSHSTNYHGRMSHTIVVANSMGRIYGDCGCICNGDDGATTHIAVWNKHEPAKSLMLIRNVKYCPFCGSRITVADRLSEIAPHKEKE